MKPKFHPIIAAVLLLLATPFSRAEKHIQIEVFDTEAGSVVVEVAKISKIKFNTTTFNLEFHNEVETSAFNYNQVKRISFSDQQTTGIGHIGATHSLTVSPNPVQDNLNLLGGENLFGDDVNIYSVTGQHIMNITGWNGDAIDVSHLSSGIYVININATTIKFIKL